MTNAKQLYYGHDQEARSIEVAIREDDVEFSRIYEFNGFQNAWSKWLKCRTMVRINENYVRYNGGVLSLVPGPYRLRLPK